MIRLPEVGRVTTPRFLQPRQRHSRPRFSCAGSHVLCWAMGSVMRRSSADRLVCIASAAGRVRLRRVPSRRPWTPRRRSRPGFRQSFGQELTMALGHVRAAAQQDDGLAIDCAGAGVKRGLITMALIRIPIDSRADILYCLVSGRGKGTGSARGLAPQGDWLRRAVRRCPRAGIPAVRPLCVGQQRGQVPKGTGSKRHASRRAGACPRCWNTGDRHQGDWLQAACFSPRRCLSPLLEHRGQAPMALR